MAWTKQKPTAPGYYWFKGFPGDEPMIVLINFKGQYLMAGGGFNLTQNILDNGEWSDKIEPPKDM
ncbi:MAG: hypothetical protein HZB59_03815 [Ignavibacteriales bacterium]|nr:hypothetical protein [Ignavibacteriales bacterium]